jgi:hypothetical protein
MVRETERGQLVDAAWLAERVLTLSVPGRRERLDVLSFGQRTFRSAPDGAVNDVAAALAGFGRFYALLLTLDRIQVTDPAMYVAAERRATALADLDGARFPTSLAQFQSALALVADIRRARTIDGPAAERLVQSLVAVDARDDGYRCGVAGWIDEVLMPSLPPRADAPDSVEARLLAAMSGIGSAAVSKPGSDVTWEGQTYRVDLAGAELRRVMYVRSKQGGPTLDDVMAFARGVRGLMALKAASASGSDLQRLTAAIAGHAALFDREQASTLSDALDALGRRSGTVVKVPADRVASLASLCDQALARVLMSVAYAMHLGNGDGSVLLGGDVSRRHDFGLKLAVAAQRRRMPWQIPVPQILPGVPWHVSGSVLALDVGLSSLALREVTAGRLAERPDAVREADRKAFSDAVALLDPRDLTDSGRAVIVETLTRGRAQVARLRDHPGEVDPVFAGVHSLRLDGLRQRAIRWTLVNDPLAIESWFSLSEVLVLGKPSTDLHAWGMSGIPFESCLCTRLQAQAPWHIFTGQLTAGVLPARITDLNLRVAEMSAALKVPAVLTRGILAAAVLDFLHDVRPSDGDDWMAFIRAARRLSRERIEDYTAALTANGPLVPMADRIEDRP